MHIGKKSYIFLFIYSLIWTTWILDQLISLLCNKLNINNFFILGTFVHVSFFFSVIFFLAIIIGCFMNKTIRKFINDSHAEIGKVHWPSLFKVRRMIKEILFFCIFVAFTLGVLDACFFLSYKFNL